MNYGRGGAVLGLRECRWMGFYGLVEMQDLSCSGRT
jgi:hypothetical protein